jgi:1-acyl-sn-glycerol-3-phosphate acyltransferase
MAKRLRENEKIAFPVPEDSRSRLAAKIRYWWCWLAASVMLLFIGLPVLLVLWALNKRRSLYPLALWGARTWLRLCGTRVKVVGLENLEDDRQYVFVSNHRSYLDTVALFAFVGKRIGLVAKKELLKAPILGQGMGFVNVIAIDRTDPEMAKRSMDRAREVMEEGYSFGVFAEGTRAMPGELLPFKKGAFHLAFQTSSPIVPVAIRNTDVLMGKRTGLLYPGEIEMIILPPIDINGKTAQKDLMDVLVSTRTAIAEELYRGL